MVIQVGIQKVQQLRARAYLFLLVASGVAARRNKEQCAHVESQYMPHPYLAPVQPFTLINGYSSG